jgi:ABC-type uncharacterized transport system involved in gliding motility auxiliary subunit
MTATTATTSVQVALRAEGLTRTYGTGDTAVPALVDASLELHPGELVVGGVAMLWLGWRPRARREPAAVAPAP